MNGESAISFKELFSKDIDRNINGVIKANDEKNLDDEVNEYVLTEEICRNLAKFLDAYNDPSNHEQNGAWISGFFGSGKSHLLKMLSHVLGEVPAELVDKLRPSFLSFLQSHTHLTQILRTIIIIPRQTAE